MKKQVLILLFLLVSTHCLFSQKEANNWYFDHQAGITFNTTEGNPAVLTNNAMVHLAGHTSTISEKNGNLLFYTDGNKVWNRAHQIMENEKSLNGDPFSNNFILPQPGIENKYFIFNCAYNRIDSLSTYFDFQYAIVDMDLNYGSGGIASTGNILNDTNHFTLLGITAVKHSNNKDDWLITIGSYGEFFAYLLSENGITKAICSKPFDQKKRYTSWGPGDIKASPDGSIIASRVGNYYDYVEKRFVVNQELHLYYFDNSTGVVSRPITLNPDYQDSTQTMFFEYSPDCSRLYYTAQLSTGSVAIFQLDLKAGSIEDVNSSLVKVAEINKKNGFFDMELGPDGKIYISRPDLTYLSAIANPNELGKDCNYIENVISLHGRECGWYLPHFMHSHHYILSIMSNSPLCLGETSYLDYTHDDNISVENCKWTGPDGFSSTECKPVRYNVQPDMEGVYRFEANIRIDGFKDSLLVKEIYVTLNPTTEVSIEANGPLSFCEGDSVGLRVRDYDSSCIYTWSTDDTTESIVVNEAGYYTVTAENYFGCIDSSTVLVRLIKFANIEIETIGSTSLCEGDSVILKVTPYKPEYTYLWSTGDTTETIVVKDPGYYSVTVENDEGCKETVGLDIKVGEELDVSITPGGIVELCKGDSLELNASPRGSACRYFWSTGSTEKSITVDSEGMYWVEVSLTSGCKGRDTVLISFSEPPEVILISDNEPVFCLGDSIIIKTVDKYINYTWSTGETEDSIVVKESGFYSVSILDSNGCEGVSDTIEIVVNNNPVPNLVKYGDMPFCEGDSVSLGVIKEFQSYLWSTGDTTQYITVKTAGTYEVVVTDANGCTGYNSMDITTSPNPEMNILFQGDLIFCKGDSVVLYTDNLFSAYLWSTGETSESITVKDPGSYSIEVTDSNCCTATDSITLEWKETKLVLPSSLDMGDVCIGNESLDTLEIFNDSEEDVYIGDIYLKENLFAINISFPVPCILPKDHGMEVYVRFAPLTDADYSDSLIVEATSPCYARYTTAISGRNMPLITFSLPDITASDGDEDVTIPLYARTELKNGQSVTGSFNTNIAFDADAFLPDSPDQGMIQNGKRIINLSGTTTLDNADRIIGEISGSMMLAFKDTTTIEIISAEWEGSPDCVETESSTLILAGKCIEDYRRVQLLFKPVMTIYPNPAGDQIDVEVSLKERGMHKLEIINVQGLSEKLESWENPSDDGTKYKFIFDTKDQATGTYFIRLRSPSGILIERVFIVK